MNHKSFKCVYFSGGHKRREHKIIFNFKCSMTLYCFSNYKDMSHGFKESAKHIIFVYENDYSVANSSLNEC